MIWNTAPYYPDAKRPYSLNEMQDIEAPIEKPILATSDISASVPEGGRHGHFLQSATASIRAGTAKIELQTGMGGHGEPVGAGSYGKEAREALREMAKAAEVQFTSVHTPVQIGNMSGFNPQQGFLDEQRKQAIEEVKKAIDFAADVAGGGAVILHTAEYQRPISEASWAKDNKGDYKFLGFNEEPGRAIFHMVDDRTGRLISEVRKSQVIREPLYKNSENDHWGTDRKGKRTFIHKGDWVDDDGNYLDPKNSEDLFHRIPEWDPETSHFKTQKLGWKEIEERTDWYNRQNPEKKSTPEEMAFRIQMQTQMLQYRGSSLYHGRRYEEEKRQLEALKKSVEYYEKLEKEIPQEEVWKILKEDRQWHRPDLVPSRYRKPSEILKEDLRQLHQSIQYTHEASSAADAQAEAIEDTLQHVKPVAQYALDQSMNSYAEAAIHAMQQSDNNPKVNRPIFIAPENIFPEMGFGSHPEELIQLVTKARERMADLLTKEKIEDPLKRFDRDGNLMDVSNPYYKEGITKEQAEKEAEEHIRATLDTQHLSMWRAHFVPDKGDTKQDTDKKFKKWYIEQVEKMADKKIIGHIHLVDSLGYGHHALPAGSGELPLKEAIEALKKRGFDGTIVSEGWEEDRFEEGRLLKKAWTTLGSPVYSQFVGRFGPKAWPGMENRWYGATQPPLYIYGAYSPSNDWVLWSEVPLE